MVNPIALTEKIAGLGRALLLVLVVCTIARVESPAQETALVLPRDTYWVGVGLGAGSEGVGGHLNGSYQFGANLLSGRAAVTAGPFDDGFNDYALLYGRATRPSRSRYHVSGAAGLAIVEGCQRSGGLSNCRDERSVLGLPIEIQAYWRPGRLVGIGLYGFANLNQTRSFAGITLGLQVGRLR